MDNTDNSANLEPERYASESSPDNGQPPDSSSSPIDTQVGVIVEGIVDLRQAVVRLGEELTALSNELIGEDGSGDPPAIPPINPDLINELTMEEIESATSRIHQFRHDMQSQVARLSETARFWLEQDAGETAFMPPEAPPGSPESTSAELGGPSHVPPTHPPIEMRPLLLGGSYQTPPIIELARQSNLAEFLRTHNSGEYSGLPQLMSGSDTSDESIDLSDYRARFQAAGRQTRNSPELPSNEEYGGMPTLMSVSDSSDDEGSPSDGSAQNENQPDSNSGAERDGERGQEESARPAPNLPYTRDPWVVPGSWMHQLLMQGQAPDSSSPPSLITSEEGQRRQFLETRVPIEGLREPHTGNAAWRASRMQKLLSSLEVLDESMLDRFCRVGGGGGEHNDQCMICWESLKAEPIGDRSWTAVENALSEENGQASTPAANPSTTSGTQHLPSTPTIPMDVSGAAALPCLHVFHSKCLVPWFDKLATTCPVCRFDLDPSKLLLFSASPLSSLRRLAGLPLPSGNGIPLGPSIRREVNPRGEVIGLDIPVLIPEADRSSTGSSIRGMNEYGDSLWPSTSRTLFPSIPTQRVDQDIDEATSSEMSSEDSMPLLSEPLANGAVDFPASNPPTAPGVEAISPLSPTSNEASSLNNPSGPHNDNSDEEPVNASPTNASTRHAPEDADIRELNAEIQALSVSDLYPDMDSVPSLIDTSELDHLFSSPNMEGIAREGSRGTLENLQRDSSTGEPYGDGFANARAISTTDNPRQAAFRNFTTETRTFLSELQDTLVNAYVRFSYIRAETAADVEVLRSQGNHWESPASNVNAAGGPSQPAFGGSATRFQPLWQSSQEAAGREWVLPKGPVEGGVANWVDKREAEIRGDLESPPR